MKIQIHTHWKINFTAALLGFFLAVTAISRADDPRTNSWFTTYAGQYARIYTSDVNKTNGVAVTTWSNTSLSQSLPAYAGVQEIYSSSNWVYIRSTGLGSHIMGPWYNDATRTTTFVNIPVNQKAFYRFPRTPTVPGTKTTTGGELGYMVDGVKMFDSRDAVSYSNASAKDGDAPGTPNGLTGDGIWNRDAYVNEATTFDPSLAHQQNTGVYHYHASPLALRYLLGDNVDFNITNKLYTANTNTPTKHSPIIAWANDGYPIYGPFGYSSASNSASGVRRMVAGFVLRNGQNGTTNLTATGRTSLPLWAQRVQSRTTLTSGQYGPAVSTSYPLGRYIEDNDYLGDLGFAQGTNTFDLDEYNGRWCVTPEFPGGTYAYFNAISASGAPVYPYNVGRQFYGNPTAGTATTITETIVTNFLGNTNLASRLNSPNVNNGMVTLTWSAMEGGSYQVEATTNLSSWTVLGTGVSPNKTTGGYTNITALDKRFYRVGRTSVASFDSAGTTSFTTGSVAPGGSATRGTTVTVTITLPSSPPNPPANAPITSVVLGGSITGTGVTYSTQGTVVTTFAIPSGFTPGTYSIVVTFTSGPPPYTISSFTINP